MTETLYGGEEPDPLIVNEGEAVEKPKTKRKPKKKPKVEGYVLKIQAMGSTIEIVSPIPRDKFVEEMVETISTHGAAPDWSGWYHLKKVDDKIVSVRLRSIDIVEEM